MLQRISRLPPGARDGGGNIGQKVAFEHTHGTPPQALAGVTDRRICWGVG